MNACADAEAAVSAHYLIEEDGRIFALVDEDKRAWHAGVSHWQGVDGINHTSIGIEIVNPGHAFGYRPFPAVQIDSLVWLLADICGRYQIRQDRIIGHSDVAPLRKDDPGELFPWDQLARAGYGIVAEGDNKTTQKRALTVKQLIAYQKHLNEIGYALDTDGLYGEQMTACVRAFQRHWRRYGVTGELDTGTCDALEDIVTKFQQYRDSYNAKENT